MLLVPGQAADVGEEDTAMCADDHDPVCPPVPGASELDSDESDDDKTWVTATACLERTSHTGRLAQTQTSHEDHIGSLLHRPPIL